MKMFDYTNSKIITKNALKARSYFLPYNSLEDLNNNKPSMIILNGEWDFSYYTSVLDLKEKVEDNVITSKINVPSCWQYNGFEKPFYVNNDYQFPFNPPMIPTSTPVGLYHRRFDVKYSKEKTYILTLLGSTSSTIYINDHEVGYFEGTHNMHEFDISKHINDGTNDIYIVSYKWCNGSYLETQDMYRDNGIFRDVYITVNPSTYIFDYSVNTERICGNKYKFNVDVCLSDSSNITKTIILYDKNNNEILKDSFSSSFSKEIDVIEWNAENPYLYKMCIILEQNGEVLECIKDNVGFKTIDIKDGIFMINNAPIKIKGVNYHESTPENGFYVPSEIFLKDIQIIKSLNCNTIRFSHYPTNPYMLELCEEYGLYAINEADIETYGCLATSNKDFVSSNEMFETHFIDRVKHLYERDKNSCSIIMWSIGNESGIGANLDKAYEYLHSVSNIPVQYETCFRGEYDEFFKDKKRGYDIISVMYPSIETLEYLNEQNDSRPFYMCEYMHSMGLGPGEMQDVWNYIYKTPRLIGGCIWEYVDHANILEDNTDISKRKYLYGGDNGEYIHDANFCCDGIVLPDRRLSTSAREMKNIYRPFIFRYENGIIYIKNTNSFSSSESYEFKMSIYKNGILDSTKIYNKELLPFDEKEFVSISFNNSYEYSYVIETMHNNDVVGVDNIIVGKYNKLSDDKAINVTDINDINGKNYSAKFDERTRTITSLNILGREIFSSCPSNSGYGDFDKNKVGFIPNIFRAPTDNDRYIKDQWFSHLFDKMWISFYEEDNKNNTFTQKGIFSPGKYEAMFDLESSCEFFEESIKVSFKVVAKYDLLALPKFGVRFQINKEFNNVTYYGFGPNENYPDIISSCYLKEFNTNASNMNEFYIKPQENGNRMNNRYVRFVNDNKIGFEIASTGKPFAFSVHDYSFEDLINARHDFEIKRRDFYEISIDGFTRGIGSQSCGPVLNEKYDLILKKGEALEFSFYIKPIM